MRTETCSGPTCSAKMLWARTINGERQPFDVTPDAAAGEFLLIKRRPEMADAETPLAISITRLGFHGDELLEQGAALYTPHHATCPDAETFR